MADVATMERAVHQLLEAFGRQDAEATGALHAPDSVVYDPGHPEPLRGRQAIQDEAQAWFTAAPDTTMEAVRLWSSADGVAAEVVIRGHQTGPLGDIPPTNMEFVQRAVAVWRFNGDGLITEEIRYYTPGDLLNQLGRD